MATNNSINFANLPTKSAPTASDLVFLSDQAASGINKQATIGSLPVSSGQLTTENLGLVATFSAGLPGMFSGIQSLSNAVSMNSTLNSNVVFIPFYTSISWAMTAIKFLQVIAGPALSTITAGIYASSTSGTFNNFPTGEPLSVGSATATAGSTYDSVTVSTTISANTLYWIGIQISTTTTISIAVGQLNIDNANIISQVAASSTWTANILTYASAYSAGSLPTLTQSSIAITPFNYLPLISFNNYGKQ